jgi:hypothetical protein
MLLGKTRSQQRIPNCTREQGYRRYRPRACVRLPRSRREIPSRRSDAGEPKCWATLRPRLRVASESSLPALWLFFFGDPTRREDSATAIRGPPFMPEHTGPRHRVEGKADLPKIRNTMRLGHPRWDSELFLASDLRSFVRVSRQLRMLLGVLRCTNCETKVIRVGASLVEKFPRRRPRLTKWLGS